MPMLEELHTTLGPQGLVVIGAHAQGGSAAELRPQVAKLGVTFTILEGRTLAKLPEFNALLRDERQCATVLTKARGLKERSANGTSASNGLTGRIIGKSGGPMLHAPVRSASATSAAFTASGTFTSRDRFMAIST